MILAIFRGLNNVQEAKFRGNQIIKRDRDGTNSHMMLLECPITICPASIQFQKDAIRVMDIAITCTHHAELLSVVLVNQQNLKELSITLEGAVEESIIFSPAKISRYNAKIEKFSFSAVCRHDSLILDYNNELDQSLRYLKLGMFVQPTDAPAKF
jgi:hypothetical protein